MRAGRLSGRRLAWGYVAAVAGPVAAAACLIPLRDTLNLASDVSVYLVLVVATALVGGLGPAILASGVSAVLLNFFFTLPFHSFTVSDPNNVVALGAFLAVAVLVSWVVDVAERRSKAAGAAAELEAADRLRAALLAAVGHDLRTPLATAKAVVSGLRSDDVDLSDADRRDLVETADEALDRLAALVANLLDMSRLQAGAMPMSLRPVPVEDVITSALDGLGVQPRQVLLEVEEDLPPVVVDPGLLERVIANLVGNAQRFSPPGVPPVVVAARAGDRVQVRVVDQGPGIPASARDRVFHPFQRLGDTNPASGTGLGLALSRGLLEAMAGSVTPSETAGGGLTMVVSLPTEETP